MEPIDALRTHLKRLLSWGDAHADLDAAVADLPPNVRGVTPPGLPYSPWQLLEHIRLTQADILAFCERPDYHEPHWPDDYWPRPAAPPDAKAWDASIAAFHRDRAALERMIADPACDLFAKVPAGTGQTFLREFLLVADHTAYHVGQLVAVRRLLGQWAK
ncbi:MAG: ABC transporter [Gemmatimonadetes bacterium]|nr:MAG: ABC transporter [Gemmatimonadota bacterium]